MPSWRVITTDLKELKVDSKDEVVADKAQADALKVIRKNPGTKVSVHFCPHTAGEPASEWYNCKDDPRAQYEEL